MKTILATPSLVLRTDFSDDAAWESICAAIEAPVGKDQFQADVTFLSNPAFDGLTVEALTMLVPKRPLGFMFIVDRTALTHPDHPILVLDLDHEYGRTFRVIPSEMWAVENNLSLANMDFRDFADSVDQDGIFRGFPPAPAGETWRALGWWVRGGRGPTG